MNEAMLTRVRELFEGATFATQLGMTADAAGEGWCEASMPIGPGHLQQHGHVHAGVVTTLADHTAGSAAYTAAPEGMDVITIEFKINFLRPAGGARLFARGVVLKAGKSIVVAESEVYADDSERGRVLVAKLVSSLAVIPMTRRTA